MKRFLLIFGVLCLFATEAKALSCGSGRYLKTDTCGGYSESCWNCPSGCKTCTPYTYATTCQYWDQEQGKVIDTWAETTLASCDVCESGYKLRERYYSDRNGKTVPNFDCDRETIPCPSNCSSCSSSSTCTQCDSGYTLKNGSCVKPCPANCAECNGSGVCTKCNSGYKLKNGACEAGSVISCPDDMKLSADGCCCIAG